MRLLVITAMFITMATILHIIEGLLPPIPVTGAKLGLANIITVAAIFFVGAQDGAGCRSGQDAAGFPVQRIGSGLCQLLRRRSQLGSDVFALPTGPAFL